MSKTANQKLNLLYLIKILAKKTDANHTLSFSKVIVELIKYIIMQNEKVYDYLESLKTLWAYLQCRKSISNQIIL